MSHNLDFIPTTLLGHHLVLTAIPFIIIEIKFHIREYKTVGENLGSAVNVFISYSRDDHYVASTLVKRLETIGFHAWVDFKGIVGGDEWKQSIDKALDTSVACLVLLTPESVASEWVRYEIARALEKNCSVIPLMIRTCVMPKNLEAIQYVDFRTDADTGFNKLSQGLIQAVVRSSYPAIPEKETTPSEIPQPQSATEVTKETGSARKHPLALVVEDSEYYCDFLEDILIEFGLDVHIAKTRNEALNLMRSNEYDFITLDMQLGPDKELKEEELGQDGIFLLSRLKRYQTDVPVVMITSLKFDEEQDERITSKGQIKKILRKPLDEKDQDKLRELVEKFVDKSE